jgi:urea ABC transporter ATP-binding protein UrtE
VLRVEAVHASYGAVPVLTGVDLELRGGEILVLLGRNGVGKTTLMRVLIGLLKPTSGQIELEGRSVTRSHPHALACAGVAYVPQGRGIFPRLTVRENLMVGTRARTDGNDAIPEQVFSYFPWLKERLSQMGGTLSGGEQQMLAIGRALCGQPKVLLLDEPSEGIQPNIVHQLGGLIGRIVETTGVAVLLVEQNLDLALQVAQRVLVMEKGRIVHESTPDTFRDEKTIREFLAI